MLNISILRFCIAYERIKGNYNRNAKLLDVFNMFFQIYNALL